MVSDEVIELLKEIEPDPDAVLRLPAQFHASQHWSQLPYAEALVSVGKGGGVRGKAEAGEGRERGGSSEGERLGLLVDKYLAEGEGLCLYAGPQYFVLPVLPPSDCLELSCYLLPAAQESQLYWESRRAEAKVIEEAAWMVHHHQNRHSVNRYAMVRRVARIMAEVTGRGGHLWGAWAR